jgi:general secretion pathway protein C
MDLDVLARRICIAAIPVLALTVFLLRRDPAEEQAEAAASASASAAAAPQPRPASSSRLGFEFTPPPQSSSRPVASAVAPQAHTLEGRVAPPEFPEKRPALVEKMAVDLPTADEPRENLGTQPLPPAAAPPPPAGPCGGIQVRLITLSKDPKWSFTSLASGLDQPAQIRRAGDRFGNWKVASIDWDRVWLSSGGIRCAVGIHAGAREALAAIRKSGGGELLAAAEGDPPPWHVSYALAKGIHKRSETEFMLTPKAIARIFKRGARLLTGLTLDPAREGDQVVGVRLGLIPPDSLLERLGLLSGDIVLAINDQPCSTLDETIAAVIQAREAGELIARMRRRGETFDLDIRALTESG